MGDSGYFLILDESADHGRYRAHPSTGGPWDEQLQHGGPPNALLVQAAERLVVAETGRVDLIAVRLAAEFVGPVPVAEVVTSARIVRVARSAALVQVELSSDERLCLQSRVWFAAAGDTSSLAPPASARELVAVESGLGADFPYGESIEWRAIAGGIPAIGPGVVWARPRQPIIAGRELTGLQRAALIGDSASGISSELDWAGWTFLNVDLDIHLARPVIGEWLLMDAATQLGTHGFALARSTLSDTAGPVGATAQTLLISPRRR